MRILFSIDRILLKHRQSVFPLFVGFVCSVIVVFCCCLFTSSVFSWQRLPSPCRCSPWISSRRSRSCGVLFVILSQRGFPATCWIHCCWVCCSLLFAWDIGWWFTDRKHCYNSHMKKPSSWIKSAALSSTAIGCLETHNAVWRHYFWMTSRRTPTKLDRFIAKTKSRWPYDARVIHARFARDEIINLTARRFARNYLHFCFSVLVPSFCLRKWPLGDVFLQL